VASIVRSDPGTDRALDADNIGAAASELEPTGEEELHGKCDAIDSDGASVELRVVTIRTHIVKKKRTTAQQKLGCSACNFTSRYAHVVRRHFLVHTGLRPYQCSHCDYSASQANNLAQHCSARHNLEVQPLTVSADSDELEIPVLATPPASAAESMAHWPLETWGVKKRRVDEPELPGEPMAQALEAASTQAESGYPFLGGGWLPDPNPIVIAASAQATVPRHAASRSTPASPPTKESNAPSEVLVLQ
jgi:hypothetical protein